MNLLSSLPLTSLAPDNQVPSSGFFFRGGLTAVCGMKKSRLSKIKGITVYSKYELLDIENIFSFVSKILVRFVGLEV